MKSTQAGFTLIELAITTVVIGVVLTYVSSMLGSLYTSKKQAYDEKQRFTNQQLADVMLTHAKQNTQLGSLPSLTTDPFKTNLAIYNPNATTGDEGNFKNLISQSRLDLTAINTDGYSNAHMRKAQILSGLTQSVPLFFQSGPAVTLRYQMAAIYNTDCISNTAPTGCTAYGRSPQLTSSNYTTWTVTAPDTSLVAFSTLPLQKQMLAETARRLGKVRDALTAYYRAQQIQQGPNDTTNWYPNSGTFTNPGDQGGNTCWSGWQALNGTSTILATIGLGQSEFATTAWGGPIEFCRDFVLDGTAANTPPHNGALRVNASVSSGSAADANLTAAAALNNLYLTF
jgi:prepilin-type N-terminal cleavage/methylation domain-containing protein